MNQQKYKGRIWSMLLIATIMLIMIMEKVQAQSSENYQIKKSAINQGGAPSQSTNYQGLDAIGQSSAIGTSSSENYFVSSGIFGHYESGPTEVNEDVSVDLPEKFKLLQNYPNPFNPLTHIEYHLPQAAEVNLTIFNVQGHVVRQLVQGRISAGHHIAIWDGSNAAGKTVASGMYFYTLITGSYKDTKKMLFLE